MAPDHPKKLLSPHDWRTPTLQFKPRIGTRNASQSASSQRKPSVFKNLVPSRTTAKGCATAELRIRLVIIFVGLEPSIKLVAAEVGIKSLRLSIQLEFQIP